MSDAGITLLWGDGQYRFRLPIGMLRELQDKTGAGPPEIMERLMTSRWRVDDVRETLRLGLIGGGMTPQKALVLTIRYIDNRPWMENVAPATNVIGAALVGVPEDQPSEGKAPGENTGGSSSPSSTASEPQSGGTLEPLTE